MSNSTSKPTAVRRRILAILVGFSLFSYLLRMNISVAQQFMVPELGLSDIQVGRTKGGDWYEREIVLGLIIENNR